ncbi:MAG: tRNA (adenosine(37)-N6)-dimethylallyltransferase MiaA [Chloroflexi bacterium]|nr:tRNA (adenosine(37)-N6)-dimethylallyltransferase MiaA [Chloroflexota bacterium]
MNHLIAIVGPTGIGKSRLALHLAGIFDGEIVNADSRQVYRHMDIGTAKPTPEELALVPHHLVSIVNPDEQFSLAQYHEMASRAISDIMERDRLPILVGGSGQYVWSTLEGWQVPPVAPDLEFRHWLEEKAVVDGEGLYQELMKIDPPAARKIDRHNLRRIIRALEVCRNTGVRFSRLRHREAPAFRTLIIGLTADRAELYRRIDLRIDRMVEQGLAEEVKRMVAMGYGFDLPAMSGIGYRQIGIFLSGELDLDEAVRLTKFETHRVARHQYAWFRPGDDRIKWFDVQKQPEPQIRALVAEFVASVPRACVKR